MGAGVMGGKHGVHTGCNHFAVPGKYGPERAAALLAVGVSQINRLAHQLLVNAGGILHDYESL